ncbi:MAG: MFS transporter, partial [Thermoplasmata archaeon]
MQYKWRVLTNTTVATLMSSIDGNIVLISLPTIGRQLPDTSATTLLWILLGYSLVTAVVLLNFGRLSDMFGRVRLYVLGFAVFTAGSFLCGFSQTGLELVGFRLVQALGAGFLFSNSAAIITDAFPPNERGRALGVNQVSIVVGAVSGLVLGGIITTTIGWRWIFFVNVPIGVIAVAITISKIAESKDPRLRRIDWVGFITFSVSLFCLVFALVRGNDLGWGSAGIVGLLVGAAVLMVAFFVNERFTSDPMLDLGLFKIPAFVGISVVAFTLAASIFAMFLYLTLYIQDDLGYGPLAAGVRFLPLTLLAFIVAFFAGRLTVRVQSRLLLGVGMLAVTAGLLLMGTTHADSTWTVLLPGFIVCGLGIGAVNPVLASGAISVVQPQRSG